MTVLEPGTAFGHDQADRTRCFVSLAGLLLEASIGVYSHERSNLQSLIVNVEAEVDPPTEDRLEQTLDYTVIAGLARSLAQGHIALVETFARRLAEECLRQPGVRMVDVSLVKPAAIANASADARIRIATRKCVDRYQQGE